jgi:hypothetical protein
MDIVTDNKIAMYKTLTRTTLDKTDNLPFAGVYIIAYMGKVVYVGKSHYNVADRIANHWRKRMTEYLGDWMDKMRLEWHNIRLDVLEPPDDVDEEQWVKQVESALVRKFNPLFNISLQVNQ